MEFLHLTCILIPLAKIRDGLFGRDTFHFRTINLPTGEALPGLITYSNHTGISRYERWTCIAVTLLTPLRFTRGRAWPCFTLPSPQVYFSVFFLGNSSLDASPRLQACQSFVIVVGTRCRFYHQACRPAAPQPFSSCNISMLGLASGITSFDSEMQ